MTTRRTARMPTRYNAWADKLIFEAVAALPEGEAIKPRTTLFKNIVHMLNHIYVIGRVFQTHLERREHGYAARNTPDHPPLDELWRAQQPIDDGYVAWSDGISAAQLEETVSFGFIGGGEGAMTRGEMLLHVVNHTTYHRGYAADLFYQIPARVPMTDLPVFLSDVKLELD